MWFSVALHYNKQKTYTNDSKNLDRMPYSLAQSRESLYNKINLSISQNLLLLQVFQLKIKRDSYLQAYSRWIQLSWLHTNEEGRMMGTLHMQALCKTRINLLTAPAQDLRTIHKTMRLLVQAPTRQIVIFSTRPAVLCSKRHHLYF